MANDIPITVIGNLTEAPELRFTPNGAAVANFTIASTPRHFNKQAGEFVDGETTFMRGSVWREQAEQAAESLQKGARVIATGTLVSRSWDDKDSGQKRTVMEMRVDEVGPSLLFASAQVTKVQRGGGNGQSAPQGQPAPWGSPQASAQPQGGGWQQGGQSSYSEAPF